MYSKIKAVLKRTPIRLLYTYGVLKLGRKSQSSESEILQRLVAEVEVPKTFVEFGFHIHEFNCTKLVGQFRGLLIDGDAAGVKIARHFLPAEVEARSCFLTLDNLDFVENHFPDSKLGVLSIDVDGNDYWFLERLIRMNPAIIIVEYNASMGLRPISVPYDPRFVRHEKHPSGWYHGASITALTALCERHGYDLVTVEPNGANLFLVRSKLRPQTIPKLSAADSYQENKLRNSHSGTIAADQWATISHLPFVEIS